MSKRFGIGKRIEITNTRSPLKGKQGVIVRGAGQVCPVIRLDGETKNRTRIYYGDMKLV